MKPPRPPSICGCSHVSPQVLAQPLARRALAALRVPGKLSLDLDAVSSAAVRKERSALLYHAPHDHVTSIL